MCHFFWFTEWQSSHVCRANCSPWGSSWQSMHLSAAVGTKRASAWQASHSTSLCWPCRA